MKYFTIPELTASAKARALGIDNTPPPGVKIKLSTLVNNLLDPIREKWGGPITVNSGYRCPTLNKAVGGVPTSQHVRGYYRRQPGQKQPTVQNDRGRRLRFRPADR